MIINLGGGKRGFRYYLEHGIKAGRDFHRNELDQRVSLIGNLDVFEMSISLHDGDGRAYDHIVLSFSERYVSNEMLNIAVTEFIAHMLCAWSDEDIDRVPVYSEAHRPRIQNYVNSETGENIERFTHAHIGIGRHDLLTGKAIEPLGFLGARSDNLKYIDAWQESFNAKHGFSSPKDNPRIIPVNSVNVNDRYTYGSVNEFTSHKSDKFALEIKLQHEILERDITTWDGFGKFLSIYGVVSKINDGFFCECYRIQLVDTEKLIRLTGVFFQRPFIELPTTEKINIIKAKEKCKYLENTLPRNESIHVTELLADWKKFRAKELKYLNTGSLFYKKIYLLANKDLRFKILNDIEREYYDITSPSTIRNREITSPANRMFGLQVRNLDGIQGRTQMLLSSDSDLDVRIEPVGGKMGAELRQANACGGDSGSSPKVNPTNAESRASKIILEFDSEELKSVHTKIEMQSMVIQPSSFLDRIQSDILERDKQMADKGSYCEIEKFIDGDLLLANLSRTHGLNPTLYQVVKNKDCAAKIQCGSRSLSPAEFLTIQLGFAWTDAAFMLRQTYQSQIEKRVFTVNSLDNNFDTERMHLAGAIIQPICDDGTRKETSIEIAATDLSYLSDKNPQSQSIASSMGKDVDSGHQNIENESKLIKKKGQVRTRGMGLN